MSNQEWDHLFEEAIENVKDQCDQPFYQLEEIDNKFNIPDCLSTGLPSLNLLCHQDRNGEAYGLPYGRAVEIFGESDSGKTTLLMELAIQNLQKGGHSYFLTSEIDAADQERFYQRAESLGYDLKDDDRFGLKPIRDIGDAKETLEETLEPYQEAAEDIEDDDGVASEELPPIAIFMDSWGGLMAANDRERYEDDKGPRQGAHSQEIHNFYKYFMFTWARLGVLFTASNHFRANMSRFGGDNKPAYDRAMKYYNSLRIQLKTLTSSKLGSNSKGEIERDGHTYQEGFPVKFQVYKIRDQMTMNGKIQIPFYYNHGFDYLESLFTACEWSGVFEPVKRSYRLNTDLINNDEALDFLCPEGKYKHSKRAWRRRIVDNPKIAQVLEKAVYEYGPQHYEKEDYVRPG